MLDGYAGWSCRTFTLDSQIGQSNWTVTGAVRWLDCVTPVTILLDFSISRFNAPLKLEIV